MKHDYKPRTAPAPRQVNTPEHIAAFLLLAIPAAVLVMALFHIQPGA